MYFYKYQKPDNLEFNMLRRGEIYFASVAELNDANECRPRFILKGTEDLWNRLAQLVLEGVCFGPGYEPLARYDPRAKQQEFRQLLGLSKSIGRLLKKRVRNEDFGIEKLGMLFVDVLRPVLEEKFTMLQSRFILELSRNFIDREIPRIIEEPRYIASFSRNAKNPTMWGHYASAEKGFVIVYATDDGKIKVQSPINILRGTRSLAEHMTEIGIYKERCLELSPVKYGRKPPKVNAFHRMIPKFSYSGEEYHYSVPFLLPGDAAEKEESKIGLVKYSDWKYEQEVRAFYPIFDERLEPDVRVLGVAIDHIRGLIFGPKMSNANKERAVLCCHLMREILAHRHLNENESLPEFSFFQARQVLDRFDFEILPVGILDGSYYGDQLPLKPLRDLGEAIGKKLRGMSEQITKGN